MYIYHQTTLENFKKILNDGSLKSSDQTGILHEGYGIYEKSPFLFFSVSKDIHEKLGSNDVILYFDSSILKNRTFYVSTLHSSNPQNIGDWKSGNKKEYRRKYSKGTPNIDSKLEQLIEDSRNVNSKHFEINFAQVALQKSLSLKNACCIHFKVSKPSKTLLKELQQEYPHLQIIIS